MEERCSAGENTLVVEGRRKLFVTGVADVDAVTDEGVRASTQLGILLIRGKGIRVVRLDSSTGALELSGEIQSVSYAGEQRSRSWLARLFR